MMENIQLNSCQGVLLAVFLGAVFWAALFLGLWVVFK